MKFNRSDLMKQREEVLQRIQKMEASLRAKRIDSHQDEAAFEEGDVEVRQGLLSVEKDRLHDIDREIALASFDS
jgi:hypothetical protein